MAKPTPGPWVYDRHPGCRRIRGNKDGPNSQGHYRITVADTPGLADDAEDLANARLIAAAPELLEALRRAEVKLSAYVGVCKGDKELTDTILPMVRSAISKATPNPEPAGEGGER